MLHARCRPEAAIEPRSDLARHVRHAGQRAAEAHAVDVPATLEVVAQAAQRGNRLEMNLAPPGSSGELSQLGCILAGEAGTPVGRGANGIVRA
jgi:hypothetical protein